MKVAYNNLEDCLPIESINFLKAIGLDVQGAEKLTEDGKLLFLIKTATNQHVLKVNLPPNNFIGKLRSKLIGSLGFQRECWFYRSIKSFNFKGNYAEYINSDKYNLLIGLLPKNNVFTLDLQEKDWRLVGNALRLFHWDTPLSDKGFKSLIHRTIYGPQGRAFLIGIPTVSRILGLKASIRYAYEILRCIMMQPKLPRMCLSHNDFLPNNLIFSKDFKKIYIIDFQDITNEKRWPLSDLIRLIAHLKNNQVKKEIITSYMQHFPSDIINSINIQAQVRFCLWVSLIHSLQWRFKNGFDYSEQVVSLRSLLYKGDMDSYCDSIVKILKECSHEK